MKRTTSYLLLIWLVWQAGTAFGQVSHGGEPLPFIPTKASGSLFEEMPSFDAAEALRTDSLYDSELRGYPFAHKFITGFNRGNSGLSYTLADGTRIWRLGIRSKGALSLNILFTEYELPEGAQVFLYSPDQTQVLGAFTHLNNSEPGLLPVSPVQGDELVIEYHEPAQASFPGRLTVGEVNHGYRDLRSYEPGGDRSEYYCMPPPVCFSEDTLSRSTVLLIIDGVRACSGVLVNNTAKDGKPYLLTAAHCLNDQFKLENLDYAHVAGKIICFFNYNSPLCSPVIRGAEEMSAASSAIRMVNEKIDMVLLELLEQPPVYYRPYYAGWTVDEKLEYPPYIGIHHPRASVKRVSIAEHTPSLDFFNIKEKEFYRDAHWRTDGWSTGSTDNGSSGSPLFDAQNRLIGVLSGGSSTCREPANNDFYAALSKAWEAETDGDKQLKHWLDPENTGRESIDGLDPYAGTAAAYRLSNIMDAKLQDSIDVTELAAPASGRLFGINSLGTVEYAEAYSTGAKTYVYGAYLVTPALSESLANLDVEVTVYGGSEKPGTLLHTQQFYPTYTGLSARDSSFLEVTKPLGRAQESFIRFDTPVETDGSFFIGYTIQAPDSASFAVYNLPKGKTTQNTAWIKEKGAWVKASSYAAASFSTSLFIDPVIGYSNLVSTEKIERLSPVFVQVGRDRQTIHIKLPAEMERADFELYSAGGQLVFSAKNVNNDISFRLRRFVSGIYVAKLKTNHYFYTQKLVF